MNLIYLLFYCILIHSLAHLAQSRHHRRNGHDRLHHRHGKGRCTRCPVGWGVIKRCDHRLNQDTLCAPCAPNTYSGHHSFKRGCYQCSRCGVGLYIAHACTSTKDTVCDSCLTVKGPKNEDFIAKCMNRTHRLKIEEKSMMESHLLLPNTKHSSLIASFGDVQSSSHHESVIGSYADDHLMSRTGVAVVSAIVAVMATLLTMPLIIICFIKMKQPHRARISFRPCCFKENENRLYQKVRTKDESETSC
ncbi:Uncharacterised protein g1409 [Pycnogonum litorale]